MIAYEGTSSLTNVTSPKPVYAVANEPVVVESYKQEAKALPVVYCELIRFVADLRRGPRSLLILRPGFDCLEGSG